MQKQPIGAFRKTQPCKNHLEVETVGIPSTSKKKNKRHGQQVRKVVHSASTLKKLEVAPHT